MNNLQNKTYERSNTTSWNHRRDKVRTARHLIPLRTSRHAEEEIRLVFSQIAEILVERFPHVFQDFHSRRVGGYREWYAENASQPYDKSDYELRNLERQIEKLESSEEHNQ